MFAGWSILELFAELKKWSCTFLIDDSKSSWVISGSVTQNDTANLLLQINMKKQ